MDTERVLTEPGDVFDREVDAALAEEPTGTPAQAPEGPAEETDKASSDAPLNPDEPTEAEGEPPEAEEVYPEFSYRADGQDHTIPGSAVGEDGLFISKESLPEVQQLLAQGRALRGSVQAHLGKLSEQSRTAEARAQAAEAQLGHVMDRISEMIRTGTYGDWLAQQEINWPVLQSEARAKALEMQLRNQQQGQQQAIQEQQQAVVEPQMRAAIDQTVTYFAQQKGLDEAQTKQVAEWLHDPAMRGALFSQSPTDDPINGVRQGEWLIDYGVVEQWVTRMAQLKPSKVQAATQQNKKLAGKPSRPAPTVGTKGGAAPEARHELAEKLKKAKTTKDIDKLIFEDSGFEAL